MEAVKSELRSEAPTLADHSALLWLRQHIRKLMGSALLQEDVLESVVDQALEDRNLIGVLLFGSVARKTHTWKSDIDLVYIYDDHEPASGLLTYYVSGVEINRFYATLGLAIENQESVPYLLHMFAQSEVLFDRQGTVTPVVDEIKQYFAAHPEIEEEWDQLVERHQIEKQGSECVPMATIMQRWDELEDKYSGGVRKRTLFTA